MARFERLIVWQKAQEFAVAVDKAAAGLRCDAAAQLRASADSIPDNIAEGSERGSAAQFAHFLAIANGSCAEAQSQLRRAHACGHLERDSFIVLIDTAQQIGWMLGALRRHVVSA